MSTYELVLGHIEDELAAGRVQLGDRLPGERALSERLGVSRSSVREALRVLEAMGVVRRATGSGPVAGAVVVADPASALTATLRLHLATRHLPISDIVEARILIETWAVRVAAGRVGPDVLAAAEQLLDTMDNPSLEPERFHRLDAEFHIRLAAMAGNELIASMMTALRDAIHGYVMAAVPHLTDWAATADTLRVEHRAVLAAVAAGDPDLAAARVAAHIEGFYQAARLH